MYTNIKSLGLFSKPYNNKMEMYHKHCHIVINDIYQLLEFRDCRIAKGCYLIDYIKTKLCVNVKKSLCYQAKYRKKSIQPVAGLKIKGKCQCDPVKGAAGGN